MDFEEFPLLFVAFAPISVVIIALKVFGWPSSDVGTFMVVLCMIVPAVGSGLIFFMLFMMEFATNQPRRTARKLLIKKLTSKFGPLSEDHLCRIESMRNDKKLIRLSKENIDAPNLHAFLQNL
jgi:hypothetical protein